MYLELFGRKKTVLFAVLAMFLCLTSYTYLSFHVLMVGDWPHNALRPIYGESWVQTGWHQSLGRMAGDDISGYDAIIVDKSIYNYSARDTSILGYSSEGNFSKLLQEYVNNGGTLIRIPFKNATNGGEIVDTIKIGKGTIIDVSVRSSPSYGSASWIALEDFWIEIFEDIMGSSKLIALDIVEFLGLSSTVVLVLCLFHSLIDTRRNKQIVENGAQKS